MKSLIATILVTPLAVIVELWRAISKRTRLTIFHQRHNALRIIGKRLGAASVPHESQPNVLAVITHVTSIEEANNPKIAAKRIERLQNTIEGLLNSFAHCGLSIVVSTVNGRHITPFLPKYQQDMITVKEHENCDPMFVGFMAQQEFTENAQTFDWFMFLEDDIIVYDSTLLEKIAFFNDHCGLKQAILLPNRYEMWDGKKTYIDLTNHNSGEEFSWNDLTNCHISGYQFAECANAHAGFYCLSQDQLQTWMRSGRSWYNEVTMVGPLESAATGCLFECFSLYKPHPRNLYFLEVQHWDTKYAPIIQEVVNKAASKFPASK